MSLLIQISNKKVFVFTGTVLISMSLFSLLRFQHICGGAKGRRNRQVYPHYWLFISNVIISSSSQLFERCCTVFSNKLTVFALCISAFLLKDKEKKFLSN